MSRKNLLKYVMDDDVEMAVEEYIDVCNKQDVEYYSNGFSKFLCKVFSEIISEEMYDAMYRVSARMRNRKRLLVIVNTLGWSNEIKEIVVERTDTFDDIYNFLDCGATPTYPETIEFIEKIGRLDIFKGFEEYLYAVYGDRLPIEILDVVYAEGGSGREKQIKELEKLDVDGLFIDKK